MSAAFSKMEDKLPVMATGEVIWEMSGRSKDKKMNRREFLKASGSSLCALSASNALAGVDSLPNILFIMTDQQIADGMSCAGNPYLKTPGMDRIAENGVIFRQAYVTQPLCQPCRTSIQTGRYPHETGVVTNKVDVKKSFPTLGRTLADAGYDCGYFGKWHVGISSKETAIHGYSPMDGAEDAHLPHKAAEFLKKKRSNPFFLTVSFVNPHNVCQLARREELPDGPIPPTPQADECPPLPDNFHICPDEPPIIRQVQEMNRDYHYPTAKWSDGEWRQYLWGYYRLIEKVDALILEVLDALRDAGNEENTLILFTSDHGEGVAAHHWNQKQILYDETVRVPFIMARKGVTKAGVVDSEHLVSTGLDIFPTFLDCAGLPIPEELPGRSLCALALGEMPTEWRDHVIAETGFARGTNHTGVTGRMVRTKRYKYVIYNKGENREQLFDLKKDPGEKKNLAKSQVHAAVLREHRARLSAWSKATDDDFPITKP